MNWFRMHSEARTDRKLDTLTDAEHRVWFGLMCMAGEGADRGFVTYESMELLALEVARGDADLLSHTMSRLVTLRIIAEHGTEIEFINWEKRQYDKPSDSPEQTRARKAAERDRKAKSDDVTPMSRDVTPRARALRTDTEDNRTEDKQNRTDTETETRAARGLSYPDEFEQFWSQYPKGEGHKGKTYGFWKKLSEQDRLDALAGLARWQSCERWQLGYIKASEIWVRDRWWENDPPPPKPKNGNGRVTDEDIDHWVTDLKERKGIA